MRLGCLLILPIYLSLVGFTWSPCLPTIAFASSTYFASRHSPRRLGTGPLSGEVKGTGLTPFLSLSIPFPFSLSSDDTWFVDKSTHVQVNDYRLYSSEFFRASMASLPHTLRRTPWAIRNAIPRIGLRCLSLSSRSPKSHNLRQTNAVFDYFVTSYAKVHQTVGIPQVMKTFLSLAFLLPGYTILLRQSPSSALILPLSTAVMASILILWVLISPALSSPTENCTWRS